MVDTLNCDDGVDRGYFRSPTAQSNRIGSEASVTRAHVLSSGGNGQWWRQTKHSAASPPSRFHLLQQHEKDGFDFLRVACFRIATLHSLNPVWCPLCSRETEAGGGGASHS